MDNVRQKTDASIIKSIGLIALCFLLTSTSWLAWEYHLLTQVSAGTADVCTMVTGYLLQALGIGLASLTIRHRESLIKKVFILALLAHFVCMLPAVLSPYTAGTLAFGFLMNLACGLIAGYYLYDLARHVDSGHKATAFAAGYGLSILASWLLSRIAGGALYYSEKVLIICAVLTAGAVWLSGIRSGKDSGANRAEEDQAEEPVMRKSTPQERRFILAACLLVLLFSVVNSSGFAFPASDISGTVNVEFSRLVYAVGLIAAGYVTDRSRKAGAVMALSALMLPFIILALRGESLSAVIFWALSYLTFGFYAVYRIILFSDIAKNKQLMCLSCFGLLAGRVGDAVGEGINLLLSGHLTVFVALTAALFGAAVAIFFRMYPALYIPEAARQQSEKERFARFASEHDLSSREQDMLQLLLQKKTNGEMADILCISENTVKFHMRNLLQKTGCRNRNELLAVYTQPEAQIGR